MKQNVPPFTFGCTTAGGLSPATTNLKLDYRTFENYTAITKKQTIIGSNTYHQYRVAFPQNWEQ